MMADPGMQAAPVPPGLSIVIPAFNEARRLPRSLDALAAYGRDSGRDLELIVCDDGSTDGTADLVEARTAMAPCLRLLRLPHRGKGSAVRAGMLAASLPYVMLCDADLSMPVEELHRFVDALDSGWQVVIGSREGPGAKRYHEPTRRHIMGRAFNLIVRLLLVPDISDSQCGFKAFQRQTAQKLFARQRLDGFSFDAEILFLARKYHCRRRQIGIQWFFDHDSRVRAITDTLGMSFDLLRIRLNDLRGRYR
jgi:dolichyl-phosphate beta-glucosyltransferase